MGRLVALPARGEVFADARGGDRVLRVSWHHDDGVVVLSMWRGQVCTGTVRMTAADVPDVVAALTRGLDQGSAAPSADRAGSRQRHRRRRTRPTTPSRPAR